MRKLIASMNLTLDGFMSGTDCELDWHFQRWTKQMADTLYSQLRMADTIVLGRITYTAMAEYWPARAKDLRFPREDIAFADLMHRHRKLVFSKTLKKTEWNNSVLLHGDAVNEIAKLKSEQGKDMIIYGSGKIVQSLINLIDEYQLWIHPILLGNGKKFFPNVQNMITMKLSNCECFASGVILLSQLPSVHAGYIPPEYYWLPF